MELYDPADFPNNAEPHKNKPDPNEFSRAAVIPEADTKPKGFIRSAIEDACKDTLHNYIIPTALEGVYSIGEGFLRRLLRQDGSKVTKAKKNSSGDGTWVSYRGYYNNNVSGGNQSDRDKAAKDALGRVDIRIMDYRSREESEDVLGTIREFFSIYDYVSVDRVYEWSGKSEYMPQNAKDWGWYDISGITMKTDMFSGKSYLYFPKVQALK